MSDYVTLYDRYGWTLSRRRFNRPGNLSWTLVHEDGLADYPVWYGPHVKDPVAFDRPEAIPKHVREDVAAIMSVVERVLATRD